MNTIVAMGLAIIWGGAIVALIFLTVERRGSLRIHREAANQEYARQLDKDTALRRKLETAKGMPECPGTRAVIDQLTAALRDQQLSVEAARAERDRIK